MKWKFFKIGKLDKYIMRKFLGTYVFAIILLVVIVIIFDLTEKIEDFIELNAPFDEIALSYYVNFIPFFINQFSGLITFISVIFFTSKMAYQTEIIAILSGGVSFNRFLYPFFLSAIIITIFSLSLNLFIIPRSNVARMEFESKYLKKNLRNMYDDYIYRQVSPGVFVQIRGYNKKAKSADFFVLSTYKNNELISSLSAQRVAFNEEKHNWTAEQYIVRNFDSGVEKLEKCKLLDTTINLTTNELNKVENHIVTLNGFELADFRVEQKSKGADTVPLIKVEEQNRLAYPFSTIILTLIGVSLSSRKVRGGTGLHISIGIALCFSYILFMKFANEFAKGSNFSPEISVWAPNVLYLLIGCYLYVKAPK